MLQTILEKMKSSGKKIAVHTYDSMASSLISGLEERLKKPFLNRDTKAGKTVREEIKETVPSLWKPFEWAVRQYFMNWLCRGAVDYFEQREAESGAIEKWKEFAEKDNVSFSGTLTHNSHLDEAIYTWVRHNNALPQVVAPGGVKVDWKLKHIGIYPFDRSRLDKESENFDRAYTKLQVELFREILIQEIPFNAALQGGRSKNGYLHPKDGLDTVLPKIMIDFQKNNDKKVVIPIVSHSFGYVFEDESFINEYYKDDSKPVKSLLGELEHGLIKFRELNKKYKIEKDGKEYGLFPAVSTVHTPIELDEFLKELENQEITHRNQQGKALTELILDKMGKGVVIQP
ncbi:hypothetical protein GF327_01345, partial [Candidatus Woesearchaeota archaeon]|nr:hypothetical protein [Candidatus Woesearchaeota archaeon]